MVGRAHPVILGALAAFALSLCAAQALDVELPRGAELVAEEWEEFGALPVLITPWQAGEVQSLRAEGTVLRRVWQVPAPGITTLQLLVPIRDALVEAGYEPLLDCEARDCGGFEFRFATDALPAPEMHVDLGDYRYFSAQRLGAAVHWAAVTISRTPERGFVQVTLVGPVDPEVGVSVPEGRVTAPTALAGPRAPSGDLARALDIDGRVVLPGLSFESGSAELGAGPVPALEELAAYLRESPEMRVILVGHTDAAGTLPRNINLSRQRAEAVRARLIDVHGMEAARLRAEGVGYLVPLTSNTTAAGRERNRRVEAVLDLVE